MPHSQLPLLHHTPTSSNLWASAQRRCLCSSSRAAAAAPGLLPCCQTSKELLVPATLVRQELSEGKAVAGGAQWLLFTHNDILDIAISRSWLSASRRITHSLMRGAARWVWNKTPTNT